MLRFEYAPISLWELDYSEIKRYLDGLRAMGVENLQAHLDTFPEAVTDCLKRFQVISVNRRTLELYGAADEAALTAYLSQIFQNEMQTNFRDELLDIWQSRLKGEHEGVHYTLSGASLDVNVSWAVLPGYQDNYARVLVAVSDIGARKKVERYLNYLGTHDALTGLYNRAFFEAERERLENSRRFPISILVADLDGLKQVNDTFGHAAGDDLLKRAAEVLHDSFRSEDLVARLGGDEFGVILPETDEASVLRMTERIQRLVELNNTLHRSPRLSISAGAATGLARGVHLVEVQRQADDRMYQFKRQRKAGKPDQTGNF